MQQENPQQPKGLNESPRTKPGYWAGRIAITLFVFVVAVVAVVLFRPLMNVQKTTNQQNKNADVQVPTPGSDPKNTTYTIDGVLIALVNGYAEVKSAPDSDAKAIVRYFGNEAGADLDGNMEEDAVLLLTRESGGSGTFYYVAAATRQNGSFVGSNAVFIGDRIAPQSTEIRNSVVVVNYADRRPSEPMAAKPTVGASAYFRWKEGALVSSPIVLESPDEGSVVSNPLKVTGMARGMWYFEASFPLTLVDWDGKIIAESHAEAKENWMTEEFVPFEGTIEFATPYKPGDQDFMKRGALILQKDNPSGLPEHSDALEIPVVFVE